MDKKIVDEESDFEYNEEEHAAFNAGKPLYGSYPQSSKGASTPVLNVSDV